MHDAYLAAGADAVETNTFGANLANLGEYGIADRIFELAEAGAAAGPGGRRRLLHAGPAPVRARLGRPGHQAADARPRAVRGRCATPTATQVAGLLAGGVDALIVETCQDLLQAKAAVVGAKRAMADGRPAACR